MTALRVVDAGSVEPYRSQALWHGIAAATAAGSAPTLSFCRPAGAYVGLGYHRRLAEIDLEACRRLGLPVIRRQIGGGPVYLDPDQLFFQITVPAAQAPPRVDQLYQQLLEPAVAAFRTLGLAAFRHGVNDIAVASGPRPAAGPRKGGPRKISGTGAGRIGDGVVVVGNVLFRFPYRRMVEVLALDSASLRRECLRLMRRHLSSLVAEGLGAVSFADARAALAAAYGRAFGGAVAAPLTAAEEAAIGRWRERLRDPSWLAGPPQPQPSTRQIKITADVRVVAVEDHGWRVEASIVGGRLERVTVAADRAAAADIGRALTGELARCGSLRRALATFGDGGRRVLGLLEPALATPV